MIFLELHKNDNEDKNTTMSLTIKIDYLNIILTDKKG